MIKKILMLLSFVWAFFYGVFSTFAAEVTSSWVVTLTPEEINSVGWWILNMAKSVLTIWVQILPYIIAFIAVFFIFWFLKWLIKRR